MYAGKKYKSTGLENVENGNVTVKMSQEKHEVGSLHWIGGSKVEANFPGMERPGY